MNPIIKGHMRRVQLTISALILAVLVFPGSAVGNSRNIGPNGFALSFDVDRVLTRFEYDSGVYDSRYTRLGLAIYKTSLQLIQPGIHFGQIVLDQSGRPVNEGLSRSGQYLGAVIHGALIDSDLLDIHGMASYTYNYTDGSVAGSTSWVEMSWQEAYARGGAAIHLGKLELGGGPYGRLISGTETETDSTGASRSSGFTHEYFTGVYAVAAYWPDPESFVRLRLERGTDGTRTGALAFTALF